MKTYFIPYKNNGGTIVDWDFTNPIHCLNWYDDGLGYAHNILYLESINKKQIRKTIKMHRFLMNFPNEMEIDHINGKRNDNEISNLRIVTHEQNQHNMECHRSGRLLGTTFRKDRNKWISKIKTINNKVKTLGSFNTEIEAHLCYIMYRRGLKLN